MLCINGIAKNGVYNGGQNGVIPIQLNHRGEVEAVFPSLLPLGKGADPQKTNEEEKRPKPQMKHSTAAEANLQLVLRFPRDVSTPSMQKKTFGNCSTTPHYL